MNHKDALAFIGENLDQFDYYFIDDYEALNNFRKWWKDEKKNLLKNRKTSTVELYDWERKMISGASGKSQSDKIRFLIRLGYLCYMNGGLDMEMSDTLDFIKDNFAKKEEKVISDPQESEEAKQANIEPCRANLEYSHNLL